MSHTGSVIEEDQSPGLIRVLSSGYKVIQENNHLELIFKKPVEEELFIIFDTQLQNSDHKRLPYGTAVKFNLRSIKDGSFLWGADHKKIRDEKVNAFKEKWEKRILKRIEFFNKRYK